ncbi:MAG: hypothetical protein M5U08_03375 [Burkholderiales bacterium]|nr:hypothetical protein [Burkholderiales bacterium]
MLAGSMKCGSSASTAAYCGVPTSAFIACVSSNHVSATPSNAGSPLR